MKKVAESEDAPTVVDEDQDQSFEKEVRGSGTGVGLEDGCTMEGSDSPVSNKTDKKKRRKPKKKKKHYSSSDSERKPKKKKTHYSSSDSDTEFFISSRPKRSCTLRANGYSAGSMGGGVKTAGIESRRLTSMAKPMRRDVENGTKTSQKIWKSDAAGARAKAGVFSGSEDDINITVKKIKLQSSRRRSVDPETATPVKKIKPDPDAAECTKERVGRTPRNCVSRSRKLILSPHSSDDSDFEKEDPDLMNASPFSGISHEGKPQDGCYSKLVVTNGDRSSTPLRKSNALVGACGKQQSSRLLQHGLEKILPKGQELEPIGINLVSSDDDKTLTSQCSPRRGTDPAKKSSSSRASHDTCSRLSGPKKRGRPKVNKDKEAASVTVTERSKECSTSKSAHLTKVPGAKRKINTEKQKLRNKLKDLLLSSGWTIELHPRRGRDYQDSVYVSPEGTGYWSITKAYAIYQKKMKISGTDDAGDADAGKVIEDNGTDQNQRESKALVSELPSFDLSILKRNVVNKRRSRAELELIRESAIHIPKKRGRKAVTKKSTGKRNGFIVPRNCNSHSAFDDLAQGRKRKKKRALVRESSHDSILDTDIYLPYAGKRTVLGWLVDSGVVSLDGNVKYMGKTQKEVPLYGQIKQEGIQCNCCDQLFTVSSFESHAGSDLCRPFENIFVEELGLSLLDCQEKAWQSQEESVRRGYYSVDIDDDPNDDTCGICGDGGELICCDSCPSTYHLGCLGMEMLPPGDWHCSYCSCIYCGAANRSTAEEDGDNFHLLACGLCERKYHQSCFLVDDSSAVDSNDIESLFCGQSCSLIFIRLQKLLGIKNNIEDGFSWSLIQRVDDSFILEPPVKANCNAKIAVALAVMDECFLPILDHKSGVNLIQNVVYNFRSNFNRLNYSGFYTFILERDDEIVAAASVRIHGRRLAEMPFIGTRSMYRRKGMCRRLLTVIEATLSSLGIERLLIPAISELEETWTNVFNFRPLDDSFNQEVKSINLMVFPGTGLLEKQILKCDKAEASCGALKIDVTKVVIYDAPQVGNGSLVSMDPENGISISQQVNGLSALDKKSYESAATLCDAADVSNNSVETTVQKDSVEMVEKEHTHFDLAVPSKPARTDGCNSSGLFDSCNLPENQDVSIRNPSTEGFWEATSLGMPHGASSFENGGSVSLNGTHCM